MAAYKYKVDDTSNTLTDNEMEMDRRATLAIRAAIQKARVCNKPIAKYDAEKHQAYIEYPDGVREYAD